MCVCVFLIQPISQSTLRYRNAAENRRQMGTESCSTPVEIEYDDDECEWQEFSAAATSAFAVDGMVCFADQCNKSDNSK